MKGVSREHLVDIFKSFEFLGYLFRKEVIAFADQYTIIDLLNPLDDIAVIPETLMVSGNG
ncbi:hypothetical protein [Xenorhabdus griffiniae]|uniref:Uncharacterized protein n=1 Tax=Xenorhabdus griffiniae TaxID=351672 RepID=A0ABY9XHQ5_9GAMM|nr:hypothetical protein [Xenorhabdus griffiniae]MBD1229200.1 hypothetical protein [Xenorhabdus griffiniae]MBE8588961.1 hypothetical protein [Xenorhabdus griffiniae]WMV72466.1 hypothetical protein QL128_20765 [Xenorhabdus griffiniae]WNH02144.1 hypothetical protein QL112_020775 [Xenorhabdus griffiniae]